MALWVLVGLVLSAEAERGMEEVQTAPAAVSTPDRARPQPDLSEAVTVEDVEIVVRRGAAKLPPVVELDGAQIDALGTWDIGGVLNHLKDLYGGEGEPLVLINGRRVPMSSVFYGFPPDAAVRVEVLPPEAAGLYGGRAGQPVYNLVLQPRYSNIDVGGAVTAPTQGGGETARLNAQRGSISGQNSQQLRASLNMDFGLLNAERDIRSANGEQEDPRVSLRPESRMFDAGGMATRQIGEWGLVVNGSGRLGESVSAVRVADRLYDNRNRTQGLNLSMGASGSLMGWQVNSNGQASLNRSQLSGFGASDSESLGLGVNVTANRGLFSLPAGQVTTNLNLGHNLNRSEMARDGVTTVTDATSQNYRAGVSLPLIKAATEGLGRIGSLQADLGWGRQVSAGGGGEDNSLGLAWQPITKLRLNLSLSESLMGAVDGLRNLPVYYGAPRTVYDFKRGEAVEVLPLLGGDPDLLAPETKSLGLNLSAGPFAPWQTMLMLAYSRNQSSKGMGNLGELTEEVQALFPERFVRGPDGRLTEVDFRPLNVGGSTNRSISSNLNLNLPVSKWLPDSLSQGASLQMRLGYSRQLEATSQLLPGEPSRDQLAGDGGGRSRQDFRLGLDGRLKTMNASLNLRWNEGYRSRRVPGVDGPDDLVRADRWVTDLRMGWQIRKKQPQASSSEGVAPRRRAEGMELSLDVSNLFDTRQEVTLGDGRPAPGYGRDRQDPIGRLVTLNLRRRF